WRRVGWRRVGTIGHRRIIPRPRSVTTMDVRIGDLAFSATDARRTVAEAVGLLDEYGEHDPDTAAALAARRSRLVDLVVDVDAWTASIDDVERLLAEVWHELA